MRTSSRTKFNLYYPHICLEGLKKITKSLTQYNQSSMWDLNPMLWWPKRYVRSPWFRHNRQCYIHWLLYIGHSVWRTCYSMSPSWYLSPSRAQQNQQVHHANLWAGINCSAIERVVWCNWKYCFLIFHWVSQTVTSLRLLLKKCLRFLYPVCVLHSLLILLHL